MGAVNPHGLPALPFPTPCTPVTQLPCCSLQAPGTVLPQGPCTCFSTWDALPHFTVQAWINLGLREASLHPW